MQKVLIVVLCVVAVAIREGSCLMNAAQVKSAVKLLRNLCVPKTKITAAQIEDLHKGLFDEDRDIKKNYVECVLRTGQLTKNGVVNVDFIQNTLDGMIDELRIPSTATLKNCKGVQAADKFELAFAFYKCSYEDNPENFFFP